MYAKKIDMRSRKAMTEFLENHFRYYTMNSWNRSTSYANCVKYHKLNLNKEQQDKFFEMLDMEYNDFYEIYVPNLIADFKRETGYDAGFNGRSGGYLVMYDTEWDGDRLRTYPGRSIDQDEDFSEWSLSELKERVRLVQRFDKLCDDIRGELVWFLDNHNVVEEEYTVTKTRKVFEEIA